MESRDRYWQLVLDAHVQKGEISVRIQIKLQRLEEGVPKLYYPKHYEKGFFVRGRSTKDLKW